MIKLQNDSQPTPTSAIEIDAAILDIQSRLDFSLAWLTHGHGKTYRNVDTSRGVTLYFPEVFLGDKRYMRITPDNDKQGQSFFIVGSEQPQDYEEGVSSFLTYDLGIVFSANLELINSTLLDTEYYQQNLIQEVRRVLNTQLVGANYKLIIDEVVREFSDVYSEFNVEEKRGISHAPLTHFRFNCTLTLREYCNDAPFDRCATILSLINPTERDCLANAIGGAPCDYNDCATLLAGMSEATKNTCVLPTYDFTDTDVQTNVTTQQQNDLIDWLCGPACESDFSTNNLSQAERISFEINDTVCINNVLYKAVILASGFIVSPATVSNSDLFFISDAQQGIIYKYAGGAVSSVYAFNNSNPFGVNPFGFIADASGFLYVETAAGGVNNLGTLVKINSNTGAITKLLDFSTTIGYSTYTTNPTGNEDKAIIGDKLYLITTRGGANNGGTILEVDVNTGANTIIHDIPTAYTSTSTRDKGQAHNINGVYYAAYNNVMFKYDPATSTASTSTMFSATVFTSQLNDSIVVGNDIYLLYNNTPRLLKYNTVTDTVTDSKILSISLPSTLFYDSVNNKIFTKSFNSVTFQSYDIATGTIAIDTTHNSTFTPSYITTNSTRQTGDFVYYTTGAQTVQQREVLKYDITNKVSTALVDSQSISSALVDGVNYIDINQSPIFLQLC